MARRPCVGFTSNARREYRIVPNKLDVEDACAAMCDGCTGVLTGDVKRLVVKQWELDWRCAEAGESAEYCGYDCELVVVSVRRLDPSTR